MSKYDPICIDLSWSPGTGSQIPFFKTYFAVKGFEGLRKT